MPIHSYRNVIKQYAYDKDVTFNGKHYHCIVANSDGNSLVFGDKLANYDFGVLWRFNGKDYIYTLYTVNPNIDCSEIATYMGGGGHRGAAGFTTNIKFL